ncbi:hypothetical protein RHMOL_Rhmol01G0261400 [Rhododendron molle]|uniref:Uncharacterized protein n=1 Tax=Rhododendron molle TaxID=49168 RepID=A0ACC0Q6Z0_RHOML|nr:hypothetical protein RHMOL_Rhmol01G0261400 [Rhododendron molle]
MFYTGLSDYIFILSIQPEGIAIEAREALLKRAARRRNNQFHKEQLGNSPRRMPWVLAISGLRSTAL